MFLISPVDIFQEGHPCLYVLYQTVSCQGFKVQNKLPRQFKVSLSKSKKIYIDKGGRVIVKSSKGKQPQSLTAWSVVVHCPSRIYSTSLESTDLPLLAQCLSSRVLWYVLLNSLFTRGVFIFFQDCVCALINSCLQIMKQKSSKNSKKTRLKAL